MFSIVDMTDPQLDHIPIEQRERLIEQAERRILAALNHARYDVDADGRPSDKTVELRLKYAIIEQALAWNRWKIDPADATANRPASTTSLGPASISYDFRDKYGESLARARDNLAPEAEAWLRPLLRQPAY